MPVENEYLVAYDYGMGGLWALAVASSEQEVQLHLPELQIVHGLPSWMSKDKFDRIRRERRFRVDDESTYPEWIRLLVSERGQN